MNFSEAFISGIQFTGIFALLLIPIGLVVLVSRKWVDNRRAEFMLEQEYVLLRVKPPENLTKSPLAMEIFLQALHQPGGEANWYDKYIKGQVRAWFSLEIVSVEGAVMFFIWTRKKFAKYIESQLYAQFPGIEVVEAEYDYTHMVDYNNIEMFSAELALAAPDPYPIRTYVDFGLEEKPDEDYKTDPILPMIEFMGSLGKNQQMWIQTIVRVHKDEDQKESVFYDPRTWGKTQDSWKEDAKEEIKKIREESLTETGDGSKTANQTKWQQLKIAALERSITKPGFDAGIRCIYLAKKDDFDGGNIGGMLSMFKPFGAGELNAFKPGYTTGFDFPWQDPRGTKEERQKKELFEAYQDREYFWRNIWNPGMFGGSSDPRKHFVLNTEELATIFHFPSGITQTPTFERVVSKSVAPPSNLPI